MSALLAPFAEAVRLVTRFDADLVEIIIRKYHLPHQFSAEARREASTVPATVPASAAEVREMVGVA